MAGLKGPLVTREDEYELTDRGEAEIRGAKTSLSSLELEILVRMDGRTSVAHLANCMSATAFERIAEGLQSLLRAKMIAYAGRSVEDDVLRLDRIKGIARSPVPSHPACPAEAAAGYESLRRQGFYVRIARRPSTRPALPGDRTPKAVVIEDEPHLAKFLKHFMTFEGFDVHVASDKAAIVRVLREPPPPDLLLMDVMLPDANGFDVLTRIRQHALLRSVPVLMLTGEATREAVIKGLACGADGYVTKPFQTDVLVNAIRTLFGLAHDRECPWAYV